VGWTDIRTNPLPSLHDDHLLVEHVGDETVVYDLETKAVHCLSPLAAVVFSHCDGRTRPADCAAIAAERLGREISEDEVLAALTQFEERSFFRSPVLTLQNGNDNGNGGISRRDFARKSAVAAGAVAFAAPLITSIAAPSAAMAASGIASGCSGCGKNPDCVSNHCCQGVPGKQCNIGCCVDHDNSCHFCNCASGVCNCTVQGSDLDAGVCPCTCGAAGCANTPCCPSGASCCTTLPAC
jgi:hypothetical protein